MKTDNKNTDKMLEVIQKNLRDELLIKNIYSFQLNDRQVRVVFSDNPKAQTVEDALVKIATRRIS